MPTELFDERFYSTNKWMKHPVQKKSSQISIIYFDRRSIVTEWLQDEMLTIIMISFDNYIITLAKSDYSFGVILNEWFILWYLKMCCRNVTDWKKLHAIHKSVREPSWLACVVLLVHVWFCACVCVSIVYETI